MQKSPCLTNTILIVLLVTGSFFTVHKAMAAEISPPPIKLSTCKASAKHHDVTIGSGGCGKNVIVDTSLTLGSITIASGGTLTFPNQPVKIDTTGIVINKGGTLEAGSSSNPVSGTGAVVTINFIDPPGTSKVVKGITVNTGGSLLLFGGSGVAAASPSASGNPQAPSWTYLSAPAGPAGLYGANLGVAGPVAANGATTLQLADNVDWQPGQWIVVAGTDFSPDSAEFVKISTVSCQTQGVCAITLDSNTPLLTYHYGGLAPDVGSKAFGDGVSQNYGIDERAEVGLVSRSIKLTSKTASANGGEIRIMAGFKNVSIQGVEIEKFGKGKKGHYPIHFHEAGTAIAGTTLIDSNSIHHSYNKCITLHATNGVTISNNVCARAIDHLYYLETGTETNDAFINNLGVGAMSNQFSLPGGNTAFWSGDYLANGYNGKPGNGYNGFNVPFSDASTVDGAFNTASGFWITNPGANTFTGNSVAGCQAFGRGFWILPSAGASTIPLAPGKFSNNRAHGCYAGFDTAADDGVTGAVNYIPQASCATGTNCDTVAEFDGLTATRNRNRGIWVRASWYAIKNARLATNRDSVSLVSSGGSEGSPPGEWSLLKDAIIVGLSANNPLRFGPCPYSGQNGFGGNAGCYSPVDGNGYPLPSWNFAGMMFYDGPARLEHVRFVNFNKDITPYLTAADLTYLNYYANSLNPIPCQNASSTPTFKYEGDAAMGWFQSNVNSYPPTQYVQNLEYYNVDLRHQVYTADVGLACAPTSPPAPNFRDGDKFTVILDHDRSLTGLQVVSGGSEPAPVADAYPISLNNLPFLSGPDTADECLSTGQQDKLLEDRPTSLISPYSYATLEFSALSPSCNGTDPACLNDNVLVFTKDQQDYGYQGKDADTKYPQFSDTTISTDNTLISVNCGGTAVDGASGIPGHACVALSGRNGEGIYEPKVVNGLGYTVGAKKGLPNFVSLMYTDAHVPGGISKTNPFQARIGLCYKNAKKTAPSSATAFTVYKGSKSFSGPNGNLATLAPRYFNPLPCNGLDNKNPGFTTDCPSQPYYPPSMSMIEPPPKVPLPSVNNVSDLQDPNKCPNGECFFYDPTSGLLFLNMTQENPNAGSAYSSPLGSCNGSKDANGICADKSFYTCPGAGCELYTIQVDSTYTPGASSDCAPYGGSTDYTQLYPSTLNKLAYSDNTVIATQLEGVKTGFPHQALTKPPERLCPRNKPATPDWPAATADGVFTLGLPSGVTASIVQGSNTVLPITGTHFYQLTPMQSYEVSAQMPSSCNPGSNPCSCTQNFTVNSAGTGYTSTGENNCQLGAGGGSTLPIPATLPALPLPKNSFLLSLPAGVTASIAQGGNTVQPIVNHSHHYQLTPNQSYTLSAQITGCSNSNGSSCSCTQDFTVNSTGIGYTSSGANCCQLGAGSTDNNLPIPAAFTCTGP